MADLSFIQANPYSQSFNDGMARADQQRRNDMVARSETFRLAQAQRQDAEAQAIDAALRREVSAGSGQATPPRSAPPRIQYASADGSAGSVMSDAGPLATIDARSQQPTSPATGKPDFARALAAVPGGGRMAMGLVQQRQNDADRHEEMAIRALGTGDLPTYRYWKAKSGLAIPPEIEQDAEKAAIFGRALDLAHKLYKDDPAQGQRFVLSFVSTPGGWDQKLISASTTAGVPRSRPTWTPTAVVENGRSVLAFYDQHAEQPRVVTTGKEIGSRSGSPRTTAFQQKLDAAKAAGYSDQDALAYASGARRVPPQDEERIAHAMAISEAKLSLVPKDNTWVQARTVEILQQWRSSSNQPQAPEVPQAPAQTTAPVHAAPTPAPAIPAAFQNVPVPQTQADFDTLPSGAVYRDPEDGQLYRKP